jgi:hypothetical protein
MTGAIRSVATLTSLTLVSMLCLMGTAEARGGWWKIGRVAVVVGTEFLSNFAGSVGAEAGRETAEQFFNRYRPPQEAERAQSYQTPYGTLSYQFQGYREGLPLYQAVLMPQQPIYMAQTCIASVSYCPLIVPVLQGSVCYCPTLFGYDLGTAR